MRRENDSNMSTELVVRTTHLMLAVETSMEETESRAGRALIFGNFATAQRQDSSS